MEPGRENFGVEPNIWYVVFTRKAANRFLSWLAMGKFKHVWAFAYCPGFKCWLTYDTELNGTRIRLLPHEAAPNLLAFYTRDCVVVRIAKNFDPMPLSIASHLAFYCVPAIKHLLGLSCVAWRPDGLYRHIMRCGGVRIDEPVNPGAADRPQSGDRTDAGPERSGHVAAE